MTSVAMLAANCIADINPPNIAAIGDLLAFASGDLLHRYAKDIRKFTVAIAPGHMLAIKGAGTKIRGKLKI
jgi:hypothetical protein